MYIFYNRIVLKSTVLDYWTSFDVKKDSKKNLHWKNTQTTIFQCILDIVMRFFIILTVLNTFIVYQSQKCIEKAWEITDNEKLPLLQAIYLQCSTSTIVLGPTVFTIKLSSNTSHLEAHAGFFRLLIRGFFDPCELCDFLTKSWFPN